jgi:uncharacterized membrane protein
LSFFFRDIRLPDGLEPFAVFSALLSLLRRFFIHIMTFVLCSSYWYAQHRLMDRMSVVGGGFSALCLLFLFLMTCLPVSMNAFGCYPTIPPAIALYTLHLACCGLALALLTWYAVFHRQLLERTIGHQMWEHALYSCPVLWSVPLNTPVILVAAAAFHKCHAAGDRLLDAHPSYGQPGAPHWPQAAGSGWARREASSVARSR